MTDYRLQGAQVALHFSLKQLLYVIISSSAVALISPWYGLSFLVGGLSIVLSQNVARRIAQLHQNHHPRTILRRIMWASTSKILIFILFLYVVFSSGIFKENYVLLGLVNALTTFFWAWLPVKKYERNS